MLIENAGRSKRYNLTLMRILEDLLDRGYEGGQDAIRCYAANRVAVPAAVVRRNGNLHRPHRQGLLYPTDRLDMLLLVNL